MKLDATERAMLAGECGEPARLALEQQLAVGRFFDAADFVPVTQAHVMADGEAVGEAGLQLLERLATSPPDARRVRVPTTTDPRGVDPRACSWLRQPEFAPERERRIVAAFEAMGLLLTDTCINYQTVMPATRGEHVAAGDTGVAIYCNAVLGARTNFEGGVAALWAALTGRVPRYGFHLDRVRVGRHHFELAFEPRDLADWGALGALIGRRMTSYFDVPVLSGVRAAPGSDALKHFGAALASYGSTPMFHMVGITPEAASAREAFDGPPPVAQPIERAELDGFFHAFLPGDAALDCVVFAAPQLSLFELGQLADLLAGRRVASQVTMLVATTSEVAAAAARSRLQDRLEQAGVRILQNVCFYQMYAREMGEAMGWRRLATNSAKLANILQGYGYEPVLMTTTACVEAAVRGKLPCG